MHIITGKLILHTNKCNNASITDKTEAFIESDFLLDQAFQSIHSISSSNRGIKMPPFHPKHLPN